MGLFVNKHIRNLFKNTKNVPGPNQEEARTSRLDELIAEQQQTNKQLLESISEIKPRYDQLQETQTAQWNEIKGKMNTLEIQGEKRDVFEKRILDRVNLLDQTTSQNHQSLLESERLIKSVSAQVSAIHETNQQISERLVGNETVQRQLAERVNDQVQVQKEIAVQLIKHEENHSEVLERIDKQEALTDKMFHQLNNIRSILYERTNYLATKIEEGYSLTSTYVYKLMTGSEQPLTFSVLQSQKKKDSVNNKE
ncbi:hypothetical protein [Bacillus sp. EB01]|uniref:hypothetical protein n=1 Tax=Bacillus sp. EB01 TaxID=1347086 RepID=UPI0005C47E36|nr:hypothetical protein [Bacillus sp. EB01]